MTGEEAYHLWAGHALLRARADHNQLGIILQQGGERVLVQMLRIVYGPVEAALRSENQAGGVAFVIDGDVCFTVVLDKKALVAKVKV